MTDRTALRTLAPLMRQTARDVSATIAIIEVLRRDRDAPTITAASAALNGAQRAAALAEALLRRAAAAIETAAGADTSLSVGAGDSGSVNPVSGTRPFKHLAPVALTPAERRVAFLVVEGMTNREIALELRISPRTVQCHVSQILRKLALRRRVDIAVAVLTNDEHLR